MGQHFLAQKKTYLTPKKEGSNTFGTQNGHFPPPQKKTTLLDMGIPYEKINTITRFKLTEIIIKFTNSHNPNE